MGDLLSIGTTGLLAAQKALDTIANNISNVSTPGYNRQVTILDTLPSVQMGKSYTGSGVNVLGVQRIVDQFLTDNLRTQNTNLAHAQSYAEVMDQVDGLFSNPDVGISQGLNGVFDALQGVNNNPGSLPERQMFIARCQILQTRFNDLSNSISSQFDSINQQITESVSLVNGITEQIAEINLQIQNMGQMTFANAPNDLLDQREQLLLNLSKYISVSAVAQNDGPINVFTGSGQPLVIGTKATVLSTKPDPYDSINTNIVAVSGNNTVDVTNSFHSGSIGGLLDIRENVLPKALNSLGRIAIALTTTFNAQHKQGIDLNGNLGTDLFNDPNDFMAQHDRVVPNVRNNGSAVFTVAINPIPTKIPTPVVFSNATGLVTAGSLPALTGGLFSLNNINIRPTVASDDTVSTSDNLGSAIAIASAINSQSGAHAVQAFPQENVVYLGNFTPGALAAGNLSINGVSVISTGVDEQTLLQDINALSAQTGVVATGDGNLNISLVAKDGRNIQLTKTANSAAANFSYFQMSSGPNLDQVARASVQLLSNDTDTILVGGAPTGIGFSSGNYPPVYSSLTTKDYILSYNGLVYTLKDANSLTTLAQSNTPSFSIDGFVLSLESGTVAVNDSFVIQPTRGAGRDFKFILNDQMKLAIASPLKVEGDLSNKGSANISVTEIINTSGLPIGNQYVLGNAFSQDLNLIPPIKIEFLSSTTYRVYDMSLGGNGVQIGPDQTYDPANVSNPIFPISGVIDKTPPGPNPTYVYDPGYRISIEGIPQLGDVFTIGYNTLSEGDNSNGLFLASLQFTKDLLAKTSTFQDLYTQFVGEIGSLASQGEINLDARQSMFESIQSRRNQISAVNLDEEAANLLQYEQAYQATAQVIVIAKGVFDSLLRAIGG